MENKQKRCTNCHKTFPATEEFFRNTGSGFRRICKHCESNLVYKKELEEQNTSLAQCQRCGMYFRQNSDSFDRLGTGFDKWCKTCVSKYKQAVKEINTKKSDKLVIEDFNKFIEQDFKNSTENKKEIPYKIETSKLIVYYRNNILSALSEESLYIPVRVWFESKGYIQGKTKVAILNGYIDIVLIHKETKQELLCEVKLQNSFHDILSAVGQLLYYKYTWEEEHTKNPITYIASTHIMDNRKLEFLEQYDIKYLPIILVPVEDK